MWILTQYDLLRLSGKELKALVEDGEESGNGRLAGEEIARRRAKRAAIRRPGDSRGRRVNPMSSWETAYMNAMSREKRGEDEDL